MLDQQALHENPPAQIDFDQDDLDSRQLDVLKVLASEQNASYTFQGIRRKLGLHQEMLSRTLKRLEEQELVQRTKDGYKIGQRASTLNYSFDYGTHYSEPVVRAELPASVSVEILFERLKGRWFSNFRWFGYAQTPQGLAMRWVTDDGSIEVQVTVNGRRLSVSAVSNRPAAEQSRVDAAYQIFNYVSRAMKSVHDADPKPALLN